MLAGVFADGWLGKAGVNMSDLLPQMLGRPAHGVLITSRAVLAVMPS